MKSFEKAAYIQNKYYVLSEVQGNSIIKNYHSSNLNATLDELKIREGDDLYAYELAIDLSSFVKKHFSSKLVL